MVARVRIRREQTQSSEVRIQEFGLGDLCSLQWEWVLRIVLPFLQLHTEAADYDAGIGIVRFRLQMFKFKVLDPKPKVLVRRVIKHESTALS